MTAIREAWVRGAEKLAAAGIDSARLDARVLLAHTMNLSPGESISAREPSVNELARYDELLARRAARDPVAYITGEREFWSLPFAVGPGVLIPRPETELLVETLVARVSAPPARILDLGTGSGAIALALAKAFPDATVTAVDESAPALALASENALSLGFTGRVQFIQGSWFETLPPGEMFDVIVSNPPYLSDGEVAEAAPEVRDHEPAGALAADSGGFADISAIIAGSGACLPAGGLC